MVAAVGLPEQVVGVALLNSAGQFGNANSEPEKSEKETVLQKFILKPLKEVFQRVVLGFLFWQAKQPARVESVLKSVSYFIGFSLNLSYIKLSLSIKLKMGCLLITLSFLKCSSQSPIPHNIASSYFTPLSFL